MRGFRGLSGVGTREITKERLLRHGSVAISARGKIFFSFLRCGHPLATPLGVTLIACNPARDCLCSILRHQPYTVNKLNQEDA